MNYGYDQTTPGFRPERMEQLAQELEAIIARYETDLYGHRARVEVDEAHPEHASRLYAGVRVRRLTHYRGETLEKMIAEFDQAYDAIMNQPSIS